MHRKGSTHPARGLTLIEAMIALVILLIGSIGIVGLRMAAIRANFSGDRMIQASALALDLEESVKLWPYNDTRLTASSSIASAAAVPPSTWDLGSQQTVTYSTNFSDFSNGPNYPTPNATTPNAIGTPYPGLTSDVDRDGVPDFFRFWNVYSVGTGPDGKLVQIIVRWKEPGGFWHQVVTATFKRNPGVF